MKKILNYIFVEITYSSLYNPCVESHVKQWVEFTQTEQLISGQAAQFLIGLVVLP